MRRPCPLTLALAAFLLTAASPAILTAQAPATQPMAAEYFPGEHWNEPGSPEQYGWSSEKLKTAEEYSKSIGSAGVFIVHHGRLIYQWGETETRMNVHSIRKSLIIAMYGRHVRAGDIRPTDTMAMLGIDDKEPSITAVEKQAAVSDLLRARSGIYHLAAYETEGMKAARPPRGSHAPGTFWYYNNWDFNVLGTIFRKATGGSVGKEFAERIAGPLQMEDFRLEDATEELEPESIHPAYPFRLTARDMARFGLMFLRQGRWRDQQVVAADWVTESTRSYSAVRDAKGQLRGGYGYMWWTTLGGQHLEGVDLPAGSFSARGAGGHHILIAPGLDLVIVHRAYSEGLVKKPVDRAQFGGLVKRILEAMPNQLSRDRKEAGLAGAHQPLPDGRGSDQPTSSPARQWRPDVLDDLVPRLMAEHKVPGVSIVGLENGRISWERQYGRRSADAPEPVDSQTVFEACSMSKVPFAYVALKLVEQGKLDLDKPLVEYLDKPYLPDEPKHKLITARMVLAHTTGLPNWREGGLAKGGPLKLIAEPGQKFTYSGEGFLYLQRTIEHIAGRPMAQLMKEMFFDPLGLTISSYVWEERYEKLAAAGHDAEGKVKSGRRHYDDANAAFSLYCTPAEYAAFLVKMMRPDRSAAHALSASSIAAMLAPTTQADTREPVVRAGVRSTAPPHWGLGWAIDATDAGNRIYHGGSNGTGFRCYCEFDPKSGDGIVIMTNAVGGEALWRAVMASEPSPAAARQPASPRRLARRVRGGYAAAVCMWRPELW